MIRLMNGYAIDVSEKCYVYGKLSSRLDKKSGKNVEYMIVGGYSSTFTNAVGSVRRAIQRDMIAGMDCNIGAVVKELELLDERFNKALAGIDA